MKKSKIIIAFLVITAMVFAGISAYAADDNQVTQEDEPKKLNEIVEKRTLTSKAYAMSDGTVRHELFATNIHYEDSKGKLKDIDIKVKDIDTAKNDGYKYKNGENGWDVYFADKGKAKDLVEVKQGDYSISFSIKGAKENAKAGKTTGLQKGKSEFHDLYKEDPTAVVYSDVMTDVDLVYMIREMYLKEDIVLNAVPESNEFTFELTTKNLKVSLKDNMLEYNDAKTGEKVFYTNNLFMEDSKGKVSTDISMKLTDKGNGKYELTVIVDDKFLKDSETVYPVVIDPTLQTGDTYDVFVASYMPTTNMNTGDTRAPYLRTGKDSPYGIRRSYIRFWTNQINDVIGAGNVITQAYFDMYLYSSSGTITLKAYQVPNSWGPSTVTWNTQPGYTGSVVTGSHYTDGWYRMDVTSWAQGWSNGTINNYGLMVKDNIEYSTSIWATFRSSDNWYAERRPRLVLSTTGTQPTPINEYGIVSNGGQIGILRQSPSTSSTVLAYIGDGTTVYINTDMNNGWYYITYSGINGYMLSSSVSIGLPTPTPSPTSTPTPTPTATPTPTPYYGNRPYDSVDSINVNCGGYALNKDEWLNFGITYAGLNTCEDESELWTFTKNHIESYLGNAIVYSDISSFDSTIDTDQYRVVLRIGYEDINGNDIVDIGAGASDDRYDFHWWYQTDSGQWAEKAGQTPSSLVSDTTGDTNPYDINWHNSYITYDSVCEYYAIDNEEE